MSLLKVNNLRKKYKARTVVHDVSFDVGSGEVVGLLGPNGAGKTTCFYMIVGLVAADGGEITLDDEVLTHRPIHQRARLGLSYLPQEMSVFRKLTVAENIQAVLELQNLTKPEIAARLEELLGELGIEHLRDNTAISLSGGERRGRARRRHRRHRVRCRPERGRGTRIRGRRTDPHTAPGRAAQEAQALTGPGSGGRGRRQT